MKNVRTSCILAVLFYMTRHCLIKNLKMIFIVVQVNEGAKILIGPLAKEAEESDLFLTLFDSITSEKYSHYNVQVEVKTETGPWILVNEGLEEKLLLMKMLNFTYLKYALLQNDIDISLSSP